jgi:hypothetical protein
MRVSYPDLSIAAETIRRMQSRLGEPIAGRILPVESWDGRKATIRERHDGRLRSSDRSYHDQAAGHCPLP